MGTTGGGGVEKQGYSEQKVGRKLVRAAKVSESHATEKTDQGSVLRWRSAPSFPATDYKTETDEAVVARTDSGENTERLHE